MTNDRRVMSDDDVVIDEHEVSSKPATAIVTVALG